MDVKSQENGSVCKVNTQDPENFDEELKSLVTAWLTLGGYNKEKKEVSAAKR